MTSEDNDQLFTGKDGVEVLIVVGSQDILVTTLDRRKIGRFEFSECEDADGRNYFVLTSMFLEGFDGAYKRRGIGTECLRRFSETNGRIVARENDGIRRDDGSHLVNDGPGFVAKMAQLGIVHQEGGEQTYDTDDGID